VSPLAHAPLDTRGLDHSRPGDDLFFLRTPSRARRPAVLLFTALPMAFVSGFSWPAEALPQGLQALRWLFPSTAGIQASLRLNQLGAPLADITGALMVLAALAMVAVLLVLLLARPPEPSARDAI
jgi:ABC-2 type transport system permease protein